MNNDATKPEISAENLKCMQAFYRVFSSKDGQTVLDKIVNYRSNLMDSALVEQDRDKKLPLLDRAYGVNEVVFLIEGAIAEINRRKEESEKDKK